MKSLLLGLAISLSAATASAGWMEIKETANFKTALIDAFNARSGTFQCTGTIFENGQAKQVTEKDISLQNFPVVIRDQMLGMWISSDKSQPLILVRYHASWGYERSIGEMYFTTDETRTQIVRLAVNEGVERKTRKNTGTIDNPIFEDVVTMDPTARVNCQ